MRILTNTIEKGELTGAYEEAMLQARIDGKIPDTIWIWKHPKMVYFLENSSVNFLDLDYIKELGLPLCRSIFQAKTTSAIIAGTDWGLFYVGKQDLGNRMDFYYDFWSKFLPLETRGNDLVIPNTDKKIGGVVSKKVGDVFMLNNTVLETIPKVDFNRLFKVPSKKYEGKTVSSPSERATSYFKETGKKIELDDMIKKTTDLLNDKGISSEIGDFTKHEADLVEQLTKKHTSEEWIKYGKIKQKPDFK